MEMQCPRKQREEIEKIMISPAGMLSSSTKGRACPEAECAMRTCFQRDIDRITHAKPFRRLKHKTQVFLQPEGDHYRTRLTHTLEVSRIARTISRALRLNEDLTEAIALGHDLGHTPFGHAGERALNTIYAKGFRHYEQSLRVVDCIAKDGKGLNLCYETRMGILHHTQGAKLEEEPDTLEAQVVRISDRIAYINHDVDDAIRAGIIGESDLPVQVRTGIGTRHSERIDRIVWDIIENSPEGKVQMSPDMEQAVQVFRDFMFEAVYYNSRAKSEESKVLDILHGIWAYYVNYPEKLPNHYRIRMEKEGKERIVCDYIAGMTDQYAIFQYGELFIPAAWKVR